MPRRKFCSFYIRAAIDRGPWSGLRNSRDQNHAHINFVIFPWRALYVALVYLIHRGTMLEKMRKTLSEAILVAMKVLMHNICACEKRDLIKSDFGNAHGFCRDAK